MQYPSITIPKLLRVGIFPYLLFFIFLHFLHLNLWNLFCFFVFFCIKLQGSTKEAFVANAIRLVLEHHQLFTHHHATKVIEATPKHCTNMGITSNLCSLEE
jgi:hypothetical protein